MVSLFVCLLPIFFFKDTATTEIYTLSLHDALPICRENTNALFRRAVKLVNGNLITLPACPGAVSCGLTISTENPMRSEEHTSELQSRLHLVCRLLLEKKKHS